MWAEMKPDVYPDQRSALGWGGEFGPTRTSPEVTLTYSASARTPGAVGCRPTLGCPVV
jgi:hypothetical protein